MKQTDYKKMFEEYSKKLNNAVTERIKKRERYDQARSMAKCQTCELFAEASKDYSPTRHNNCVKDSKCIKVKQTYDQLSTCLSDETKQRNDYAKAIYIALSESKPMLVRRKDSEEVEWMDAFGSDYESLDEGLKNSLVALIEEDGGRYRIKGY